jgi:hypothetical protein
MVKVCAEVHESKLIYVLYIGVCMVTKTNINCKVLSVSQKLETIKKE